MTDVQRLADIMLGRYDHVQANASYVWPWASQRVIDCVLSLNRRYHAVVKPRVENFSANHAQVQSLSDLKTCISTFPSPTAFCAAELNYRDPRRAQTLAGVIDYLIDAQIEHEGADENERLSRWAAWVRPGDYLTVGVSGFGLAGFQYLRMLFGAQTTKPDVHIIRFVSEQLGRKVADVQALNLMERAARLAGLPLREVDAEIWRERAAK